MARKIRTILFKADSKGKQQILDMLNARGFETITYQAPEQCPLQKSHSCRCDQTQTCTDILISDFDLPGISGLDYIESQISKGCKAKNIALMSSNWSSPDIQRAESLGYTIFEKPTRRSSLESWLDTCEERINRKSLLNDWFIE